MCLRLFSFIVFVLVWRSEGFSARKHTARRSPWTAMVPLSATASATAALPDGMTKSIQTPGSGPLVSFGDICSLSYACYVLNENGDRVMFAKSPSQKCVLGDSGMIDAWDSALATMRVGERCIVQVTDSSLAYGVSGVPPVVPPKAVVELDLELIDAQPATANIDFDSIAMADKTPRTAADIEAAFARKMAAKSNEPQLEGLDLFLKKAKNFYFFGLFEGETGERPPWFLRPSITFPLAFAVVGAAFYISYAGGAISERGAQVTDELDEIILSMNGPVTTMVAANIMNLYL